MADEKPTTVMTYVLRGNIDDQSVGTAIDAIVAANKSTCCTYERVDLYLVSSGGSVAAGFGLIDMIELSKVPVHTIAAGHCESMATAILMAGARRFATKRTKIMIHPTKANTDMSRMSELQAATELYRRNEKQLFRYMAEHVGMTYDEYVTFMGDQRFLTSTQARKHGFIDEVRKSL